MPQIMQQPQNPDEISRRAGLDIYECSVGMLRRAELWRLGNAWGMKFPVGASKDFMLPFFKQLEANGKNPLRPPQGNLDALVKTHECEFSSEIHAETVEEENKPGTDVLVMDPTDNIPTVLGLDGKPEKPQITFKERLEILPHGQLKKICKLRGIPQGRQDKKKDLIASILAAAGEPSD